MAQLVKNLPAVQETWVWSLGWEDPWRRERLPTPVFWPGEFHVLYSPWGRKESDKTERLSISLSSTLTLSPLGPWVREKKGGGKHLKIDNYPGHLLQKSEVMLCNCQRTCWEESQSCVKVSLLTITSFTRPSYITHCFGSQISNSGDDNIDQQGVPYPQISFPGH